MSDLFLTEKEKLFIVAFGQSDYFDGVETKLWDFSVHDYLPYKGKTRSGVVSSLIQKGVISIIDKSEFGKDNKFNVYKINEDFHKDELILNLLSDE